MGTVGREISITDLESPLIAVIRKAQSDYFVIGKSVDHNERLVTQIASQPGLGAQTDLSTLIFDKRAATTLIQQLEFVFVASVDNVSLNFDPCLDQAIQILKKRFFKVYRESVYD